ncbi:GNAT family N-acetyltransferase [Spirulina sp. CS-785/01]|uniref:GNAT family N-acetyltransferase n=1 Tax=Spirulina sp. CS-785/01 TaxID=3021716 RepID=UPI002330879C|nr:GNAT family N-acetyltransferase [Spirulina sp. CS-785/01]MDB9312966.1 GNAT family N-acetyltransferase [Spirulina sp. CS-785/01]
MSSKPQKVYLRPANCNDCQLLWEWVNDSKVRSASFSSNIISWENHKKWFHEKLQSSNSHIFIAFDSDDQPIGQVRFEIQNQAHAEISISIVNSQRGLGYGCLIVNQGLQEVVNQTSVKVVTAWIKVENLASQKLFEKANFKKIEKKQYQGCLAFKYQKLIKS